MIIEDKNFSKKLFTGIKNYKKYIAKNKLDKKLKINLKNYTNSQNKITNNQYYNVDTNIKNPFPPELDDLSRLHYLVISRKVNTILEFGVGKSTVIFNFGLIENQLRYGDFVKKNLRIPNAFLCFSLDNYKTWVNKVKSEYNLKNVKFCISTLNMSTFNGNICTFYDKLPNICPDLIYLDGPDQFNIKDNVSGFNLEHKDMMPMSCDILKFEHFLTPGTIIITDGRAANARFLKTNFQRDWKYLYDKLNDQHLFYLKEPPLGKYNSKQLDFYFKKSLEISDSLDASIFVSYAELIHKPRQEKRHFEDKLKYVINMDLNKKNKL